MVDSALVALKKVLFGSGLLTPAIQLAATALLSDTLPTEWLHKWEGPDKPQAWLNEIVRKRLSLIKLRSMKSQLLSEKLVLSDFFHPATFINALRQQTARKLGVAIDAVTMISSWGSMSSPELRESPLPCPITGLLLQGASLKGGELQDLSPDSNEISPAPVVYIGFIIKKDDNNNNNFVDVPLYHSPSREDFIVSLQMPLSSISNRSKFILSGIGLFLCETD
jgi:dynein heavy chain 2